MCACFYNGSDQRPGDGGGIFLSQLLLVKSAIKTSKALSLSVHGTDRTQQWHLSGVLCLSSSKIAALFLMLEKNQISHHPQKV